MLIILFIFVGFMRIIMRPEVSGARTPATAMQKTPARRPHPKQKPPGRAVFYDVKSIVLSVHFEV